MCLEHVVPAGTQARATKINQFFILKKLLADKFSLGAGQNLAYIGASPNEPSTNDGIRGGVLGWYNEYKDTTMSDIRSMNRIYTNE